jgi:large subunit ribosomal protein L17
LATKFIIHKRLRLIKRRAKDLQSLVEKLITLGKKDTLHARRQAAAILRHEYVKKDETALQHLFNVISVTYQNRNGGYTKIINIKNRIGDNSKIVELILV